jgi:hypothetical protein
VILHAATATAGQEAAPFDVKVLYLGRKCGGELAGVESGYGLDACLPLQQAAD